MLRCYHKRCRGGGGAGGSHCSGLSRNVRTLSALSSCTGTEPRRGYAGMHHACAVPARACYWKTGVEKEPRRRLLADRLLFRRFRIARHFGSSCQRFQAHRHTAGRYTVTPGRSGGALKTSRAWARACGALPSTRRRRAAPRSGTSQRQTVDSGWRDRHESRVSNKQA